MSELRARESTTNDAFVDQRIASLESFYEKSIRKTTELLSRGEQAGRQERYLRMLRSQLARLDSKRQEKRSELERLRTVSAEYDIIDAGILEVVAK
jgi:hypothetical protein